jgi:hypothetical protein
VNGKSVGRGGGPLAAGKAKYTEVMEVVNDQLETPATVKLNLDIAKDGAAWKAVAKVSELGKPGEKVVLRFAVVEERVRYNGSNGSRFHSHVVRAMPGGIKGFPLTKKEQQETVTINVEDLRKTLAKYLEDFAKEQGEFARSERPLALTNLKLIAFIQNDETKEILNAAQVELGSK